MTDPGIKNEQSGESADFARPPRHPDPGGGEPFGPSASGNKANPGPANGPEATILLIDDEVHVLNVVKSLLERRGFNVIAARNGPVGIREFNQRSEEIQLVILDRNMPHMDGAEVSRRLKEIDESVPILISSGEDQAALARHCRELDLGGFLCKPFSLKELMEKVNSALDRRSYEN